MTQRPQTLPGATPGPMPPQFGWQPAPPPPPPLPVDDRDFATFWRTPAYAVWRPIVTIALALVGFMMVSILQAIPMIVDLVNGAVSLEDLAQGKLRMSPFFLFMTGASLALLIPISLVLQRWPGGQPMRYLHSVEGRLRGKWLAVCFAVIVPLWLAVMLVPTLIAGFERGHTDQLVAYLAIIFLLIPFQAAGEEYLFRGVLNRAVASFFPNFTAGRIVAAVVTSALFAAAHGAGDVWLNIFYFVLGLILCALVWQTGGLEAAIALHVVNNVISFTFTVMAGELDKAFDRQAGVGDPSVLVPLVAGLVVLGILRFLARRQKLAYATAPGRELIAAQPAMDRREWGPPRTLDHL